LLITAQRQQDWILLGDRAMAENDPYGALRYYGEAMEIDSANGRLNYKFAEALRANQAYAKAAYYYDKVYSRGRGKIFEKGGAWLATMLMQTGKYEKAKQQWRRVREQYSDNKESYWYQKAVQSMRSCDLTREWLKEGVPFELKPLPEKVNSPASEFAGYFTDADELIFTSLRGSFDEKGRLTEEPEKYQPGLYKTDSTFSVPEPFEFNKTSVSPAFNYSLSEKNDTMATVTKNESGQNQIVIFSGEKVLKKIPARADTSWYSHPAFGRVNGNEVLYFASNRPGGYGREDIWYVDLKEGGEPINCGEFINSPGSEITPFYRSDRQMLYYASDWHHGFGGYDLLKSDELNGEFNFPENLKRPYNSPSNDLYYSFNESVSKGSVTSNRSGANQTTGEATCCNDLWLFEERKEKMDTLPEIETLEALNDYLPVELYFHNDEPDPRTTAESTDQDYMETYYKYTRLLPDYQREYREGLGAGAGNEAEEAIDRFFIDKIDRGVKNLELFTELLRKGLEEGQRIELTIKGFASPLAKTDYNVKLTSRRIASLINYLREYERGVLLPYLNKTSAAEGSLSINQVPFGEYVASKVVSDNPNEKNAIYGIAAAQERKIQIVSVQRAEEDSNLARVQFDTEIFDLGLVQAGDRLDFQFSYQAEDSLQIDSLDYDRERISMNKIRGGTKGLIEGKLIPASLSGKQNLIITLFGNIAERRKELNIAFEVE
jgi:hypothetical protein